MKTSTLRIICIILGIIIIAMAIVAFIRIEKIKHESADLRNYVKQLEVNLNIKDIQIKDLQSELTGAYQEMEYYAIKYHGNALALYQLEDKYRVTKSYAGMAEYILIKQGIEFYQVD